LGLRSCSQWQIPSIELGFEKLHRRARSTAFLTEVPTLLGANFPGRLQQISRLAKVRRERDRASALAFRPWRRTHAFLQVPEDFEWNRLQPVCFLNCIVTQTKVKRKQAEACSTQTGMAHSGSCGGAASANAKPQRGGTLISPRVPPRRGLASHSTHPHCFRCGLRLVASLRDFPERRDDGLIYIGEFKALQKDHSFSFENALRK
jgi:hypothetical protein